MLKHVIERTGHVRCVLQQLGVRRDVAFQPITNIYCSHIDIMLKEVVYYLP